MPPRNGLPKWIYVQYRSNSNNTTELRLGRIFDDEPWLTILHKKMISCHILKRSVCILKHQQDSNYQSDWSFNFHDKWDIIYIYILHYGGIYIFNPHYIRIYIYISIHPYGRSLFFDVQTFAQELLSGGSADASVLSGAARDRRLLGGRRWEASWNGGTPGPPNHAF